MIDLQSHYKAQATASFWTRPRNAAMSREINSYSLSRLNQLYNLNANSKAEAVRRILYDGGFSYDGVLPAGALQGDPQFSSAYNCNAITAFSVMREHLERDVKSRGYDCTGRRQKSLYMQALAGNKTARKTLDAAYHGDFPSHPRDAWFAIERIMHDAYEAYLKQYNCPNRLCTHPMYPAISPPLPNPVRLRGFVLRARRARDSDTLSWMLGRDIESQEMSAGNAERLVQSILNRFGYKATEIAAMNSIINEQEVKRKRSAADKPEINGEESGSFLLGCFFLFVPIALCFGAISFASYLIRNGGGVSNIVGMILLMGVLGFLVVLCRVFRGKKGRPP